MTIGQGRDDIMRLKDTIDRIPGGLMLAPLMLGALCRTFAPDAPNYFKGFTQGIMTGVVPILAVWFFCMGASIKLSATGTVLRKSGTLVLTKFLAAWAITIVATWLLPPEGIQTGFFAGLSVLAIVCAMDMSNGGLYASLMQTYGTREEAGAFVLTSIESGPLMSMIILGASGVAHFEPQVFVGAVLPFIIGFALGNLDPKLRDFFTPGGMLMIPFFAFSLGNTVDLSNLLSPLAGLGVLLALSVIVLTAIPLILADRFIGGGTGTAGLAASSTAGAAAANPLAIAAVAPQFSGAVKTATPLVAICVIVTSLVVPILTGLWYRKFGQGKAELVESESGAVDAAGHPLLPSSAAGGHF
jgi:2-keto-3-deoxygluconate permease